MRSGADAATAMIQASEIIQKRFIIRSFVACLTPRVKLQADQIVRPRSGRRQ
jgi:hypothetical protein